MSIKHYNNLFWIGFLNIAIALVGFFINQNIDNNITQMSKTIRIFVLIFSYWHLIKIRPINSLEKNYSSYQLFKWFLILILLSTIFSSNPFYVFSKILNFIPSAFFVLVFINVSFEVLGLRDTKKLILKIFITSYSIPLIISIFSNDNYYFGKNIYMDTSGIRSNNLAWAASIVLASTIAYIDNFSSNRYKKVILLFLMIFCIMSILNSGSRTILAGTIIYFIFVIWKKTSGVRFRILKLMMILFFITLFFNSFNITKLDSIDFLIGRTKRHIYLQENFARIIFLETGFMTLEKNPMRYFVGNGLFNDIVLTDLERTFVNHRGEIRNVYGYHNSYADIFFGGGIFLFFIFSIIFIFKPLKLIWYNKNTFFLLFIPLNIIAFTENSLPGGAYIFYPYFMYTAVINLKSNAIK